MTESTAIRQEIVCFQIGFRLVAAIMLDWEPNRCPTCGVHHGNAYFGVMDAQRWNYVVLPFGDANA